MWYKSKKPDWSSNHYSFLARTCQKKHAKTSPWISWCECKETTNSPCFIKFFMVSCFINHCWPKNHRPTEIRHSTTRKSRQKGCRRLASGSQVLQADKPHPEWFGDGNGGRSSVVGSFIHWIHGGGVSNPENVGHLLNSICHVSYGWRTFWLLSLEVSPQNRRCWTQITCHTKMVVISPILSGSLGVWLESRLKTWPSEWQCGHESL